MRLQIFLSFFLLSLSLPTVAIDVSGTALGFEGRFIRLYTVSDFISYKEIRSDVTKIGDDGKFHLKAYASGDQLIKLKIEDKSVSLICENDVQIKVALSFDEELNKARIFDKELTVEIQNSSDNEINALIWGFQRSYAAFLEKHQSQLVSKQIMPEVRKFQDKMKQKYSGNTSTYFNAYLEYSLFGLEDAVLGSETKLYESCIKARRIAYSNLAYMSFFTQFYQQRFIQISQGKEGFQMLSAVNGSQDYSKLMTLVKNHEFIDNDTLAQLFIINGLKEVYGDETFKKKKVLQMLKTLESRAVNNMNRKIALNVYEELTFMDPGKMAPDFSLFDDKRNVHHLTDYSKAPVLLCFWSAYSNACLRDLSFLSDYAEKYSESIQVIAICIDDKKDKAKKIINEKSYAWMNLYKDAQYDVTDKYRILSVPTYVILNSKNIVVKYPASNPERNLEAEIYRLISEK